jgi:peptide/nickel transport system substrate-binding protein
MRRGSSALYLLMALTGAALLALSAGELAAGAGGAAPPKLAKGGTLTVALAEDPDRLDPTLARTFVGRIVFANMCEKLYDVNNRLAVVPQLASALPTFSRDGLTVTIPLQRGIKFNDGTRFDAAAVKTSLDRHRTLAGSVRASELAQVASVDVVNPNTIRLRLSTAFSPLVAQLADRAGMIMSPTALASLGDKFSNTPVCVGPFNYVSRAAGDNIVLERSAQYYDAESVNVDRIVFRIMTEGTVRAQNLRSRDVDVAERLPPQEIRAVRADKGLLLRKQLSLGYQGITINMGNKNGVTKPFERVDLPLAQRSFLRQAFELSLDRKTINRVALGGTSVPGCTPISPASEWSEGLTPPCPARNVELARKLVAATKLPTPIKVKLMVGTSEQNLRIGQVIQAMAREAGFDIELQPTEFVTALRRQDAGQYEMFQIGWSGRVDPDGNIYSFHHTKGTQNVAGASDPRIDALLDQSRTETTTAKRKEAYRKALDLIRKRRSIIYLWHPNNFTGQQLRVRNVVIFGDGLLRLKTAGFVAAS